MSEYKILEHGLRLAEAIIQSKMIAERIQVAIPKPEEELVFKEIPKPLNQFRNPHGYATVPAGERVTVWNFDVPPDHVFHIEQIGTNWFEDTYLVFLIDGSQREKVEHFYGSINAPQDVSRRFIHARHNVRWIAVNNSSDDVVYEVLCIPPDSIVFANPLPKTINQIKIGEHVLSHDGKFHRVSKIFKRPYNGKIVSLKVRGFPFELKFTPNHPILVAERKVVRTSKTTLIRATKPKWKRAENINVGDYLVEPVIQEESNEKYLDLAENLKCFFWEKGKKIPLENPPEFIVYQNRIYTLQRNRWGALVRTRCKGVRRFINKAKLARLCGYYAAEGSSFSKGIQIGNTNREILNDCLKLFEIFGIGKGYINKQDLRKYRKYRPTPLASLNSSVVKRIFNEWFGNRADMKRVPDWILEADQNTIKEFLIGYWRGDGDKQKKRRDFRFSTTSLPLALGVQALLLKIGITSTLSLEKQSRKAFGTKPLYRIHVTSDAEKLKRILCVSLDKKEEVRHHVFIQDNYAFYKVKSVKYENYRGEVMNLKVEDANSYLVGLFIVHNCDGTLYHKDDWEKVWKKHLI